MSEQKIDNTDLKQLLSHMSPELLDKHYVFLSFPDAAYGDYAELQPVAVMSESEGLTLVVPEGLASKHGYPFDGIFRCITLMVHSSLEAVGLTAVFAKQLATRGISANVIAGFYHDHIFVPQGDAKKALESLKELARTG